MWLGCVKRLNEPGCTLQDAKRIRLILTALKSYIIVYSDYYERIRNVEEKIAKQNDFILGYAKEQYSRAETEKQRARWKREVEELEAKAEERLEAEQYHVWSRITRKL
ncbi:MAG: hypothetical protein QMD23_03685 [Candidatus Bathyarchaeia archaeon]|nr:hypothetical protein [Candidatus Bathyarchaeia archaeon]